METEEIKKIRDDWFFQSEARGGLNSTQTCTWWLAKLSSLHSTWVKEQREKVEQVMTNNILFIGNEMPNGMEKDTRDKYVLLGKPSDLLDSLSTGRNLEK